MPATSPYPSSKELLEGYRDRVVALLRADIEEAHPHLHATPRTMPPVETYASDLRSLLRRAVWQCGGSRSHHPRAVCSGCGLLHVGATVARRAQASEPGAL